MNKDDSDKSFMEEFREGRREVERELEGKRSESIDNETQKKIEQNIVKGAKSDSVTVDRLIGANQFFHNVIPFLEDNEQPHFVFPLTQGIFAEDGLVVESGAEREKLIEKHEGGSVVVTNRYVRIHSDKGEWTIPYDSVVSVDFVGHPALHIQTSGRTYYINIAGTKFDEEENVSQAARYIRKKRQGQGESASRDDSLDPLEKLEKLSDLKESGVISEEEFQNKKQDLLDEL